MATLKDKEYEAKLQNLRRHAPFLKGMIDKLRTQERTQQVSKLESLWSMITSNKRLKLETLQKCEDVMLKLQSKSLAVVNSLVSQPDKTPSKGLKPDKNVAVIMNAVKLNIARAKLHNEVTPTPKSPTPDRDLPSHIPITIPMDKVDIADEIASPDPDDDPTTSWNETSENRYDAAKPDVYTNAVMKPFKPPTPIIPSVNINTPPISMQDLQQLEESIPVEKKQELKKKEPSAEEKLLKRPSKVSLVPAPIIKPKPKKNDGNKVSELDKSKSKTDDTKKPRKEKDSIQSKPDQSTGPCNKTPESISVEKERRKSSDSSSSKHSSSKSKSSSRKSSKQASHSGSSKAKDSKKKDGNSKIPCTEETNENQANKKTTVFGNLLSSLDNTLMSEKETAKKKATTKPTTNTSAKPHKASNQDKSNKPPPIPPVSDVVPKPTVEKTVFKRLADKYNPRPKKREPEVEQSMETVVSPRQELWPSLYPNNLIRNPMASPSIFQHPSIVNQSIRFSPPSESQMMHQQQQQQFNMPQRRASINPYDTANTPMSPMVDFNMEYDLSKMAVADFYHNKSPPFIQNMRQPEPLLNRLGSMPHQDAFQCHDFQGRILHPDHPRTDPRLSRQIMPEIQPPNNFEGNRFFRQDDNNFDGKRFTSPTDNNVGFVRPEENNSFDSRLLRSEDFDRPINDNEFVRLEDNNFDANRSGRPLDSLDRTRDGNWSFRPNNFERSGKRFFRSTENNMDIRQTDGNRFVWTGEARDNLNRSFRPAKPETNRFARPEDKAIPKHEDDHNEIKRVPQIEENARLDPRLLIKLKEEPPSNPVPMKNKLKVEPPSNPVPMKNKVKVEPPSNPVQIKSKLKVEPHSKAIQKKKKIRLENSVPIKREVYDDIYSRINSKDRDRESFTSPLDSIYEKKHTITGKGYGVQNFRIPKKPRLPPPVVKRQTSPTPPRRRSLSPPLRRPPTPPRKRRSPSPPEERVLTASPPPKIIDDRKIDDVPGIVAQLPESIRKDDRFGDVVTVLSSLLKDENALTKIKKLLKKGANDSSSDNDSLGKTVATKQRKTKKLVKRQPKNAAASKKAVAAKNSPSLSVDSASTDTESIQVRRSGRLRKRVAVFIDDDSEDATVTESNTPTNEMDAICNEPPLTDEQLDDIAACIDPFDAFMPDNEADQLVEEALKQPAEKLEEEINKQLVNDIFDSLKNEDNIIDVPAEGTQQIFDSWGLAVANADQMIDSWDKKITDDLFDKDEKDQDRQEDVRNEIDELIKNMPLNDSDKILDCDKNIVEPVVTKPSDRDEISKCDDVISSITKKLTEENSTFQKDVEPSVDEPTKIVEDTDELKESLETENELNIWRTRPLRSSPRVRAPVCYADEIKPRAKRVAKKLDPESTSLKKQEVAPEKIFSDANQIKDIESRTKQSESEYKTSDKEAGKADKNSFPPNEEIAAQHDQQSESIIHLDMVITELIAKYSVDDGEGSSEFGNPSTKEYCKKLGPKSKNKVFPIRQVKVEPEENDQTEKSLEVIGQEESAVATKTIDKKVKKLSTPKADDISVEISNETELLERPISKNANKPIAEQEKPNETSAATVEKSQKKNKKPTTVNTVQTSTNEITSVIDKTAKVGEPDIEDIFSASRDETKMNNVKSLENLDSSSEKSDGNEDIASAKNCKVKKSIIEDAASKVHTIGKPLEPSDKEEVPEEMYNTSNKGGPDSEEASPIEVKAAENDDDNGAFLEEVENFSDGKSTNDDLPLKKTILNKKRAIVKKRGRPLKARPVKKQPSSKPLVESSATSEAGSTTDLSAITVSTATKAKVNRPRQRKRTELDKLHEDIKETMGDKVLTSKRTCMKSPRAADEPEEAEKAKETSESDDENEQLSTIVQALAQRQKTKGLKVVSEHLPKKPLAIGKKGLKAKQPQKKTAQSEEEEEEEVSDSDDNEVPTVLPLETNKQSSVGKRKKRHNIWKSGVIRTSKKKKSNAKSDTPASDKTSTNEHEDSDLSDDIDTDYDVEFVEPDAGHFLLKGNPTKCRLCDFEGTTLVEHYVNNHRAGEVPVSRMCPEDSKLALEEAKQNNYYKDIVPKDLLVSDSRKKKVRFTFTCRFCLQEFAQFSNVQFVDHISTHTGEYRHKCINCDLKNASARSIKNHHEEEHGGNDDKKNGGNLFEVIIPPPLNFHTVFGYMCSECHFLQLSYRSVTEHIQIYHLDESATAIKINMSLKKKPPPVIETIETGIFTSQEVVMEEQLQREEEANRTELMKEVHKEVTGSRLSSVAALLKNRFDSSPTIEPETLLVPEQCNKEVVRLPKAKPKEGDIKPNLAELQQQQQQNASNTSSEVTLPKPLNVKYTIFIIGPLKAVVTHADRSVDFACITDDCVFYTTDRCDMAQHCKTAHDNRCEKIRCGYCAFVGNAVTLVQVFEHICGTHVDPLLVKDEPSEKQPVEEDRIEIVSVDEQKNVHKEKQIIESPSPPRLPFMGNHFGIKIVSVSGGVLDDITPIMNDQQEITNSTNDQELQEQANDGDNTNNMDGGDTNQLPKLLPISLQSPSVLKKLSSLQKHIQAKSVGVVPADGIIVSKVTMKGSPASTSNSYKSLPSKTNSFILPTANSSSPTLPQDYFHSIPNPLDITDDDEPLLLNNDNSNNDVTTDVDSRDCHQQVLARLALVSTLPEDSATATKRRFHTGKTDLLYRCPDSRCGFASGTRKEFDLHVNGGHNDLKRSYRCVYCYTTLPLEYYSAHILYYHGTSQFGCSRCCYRAVTPYQIQLHKTNYHQYDATDVQLLPLANDVPKTDIEKAMLQYTSDRLKSIIKPYSCYCGERFIVTVNYSAHLEKMHRADLQNNGIDCRDCQMKNGKHMTSHYSQVHNNHLYHCAYCSFGVELVASDVFSHQSARHPGLPMKVIVRSIQNDILSCKPRQSEDETIWTKLVRLDNPQASEDMEIIKKLHQNHLEKTTVISNKQQNQTVTLDEHLSPTSPPISNQKPHPVTEDIETIDLIALSPEAFVENESPPDDIIIVEEEPQASDLDKNMMPIMTTVVKPNTFNISGAMITPPRCVTPTNQRIPSPSVSSNMTTPDENIFVVLQPSSEVPLAGSDLFVCAQCGIHCTSSGVFRLHMHDCVKLGLEAQMNGSGVDREANLKPYACAHCDKRSKTSTALLDHMRVHGFPRYRCGLCDFKHTQPWNVRTHMRTEHNISTCAQVPAHPNKVDDDFDDFIYRPRQSQLLTPSTSVVNTLQSLSCISGGGGGGGGGGGNSNNTAAAPSQQESSRRGGGDGGKDRKLSTGSVSSVEGSGGDSSSLGCDGFAVPMQKFLPTEVDNLPMRAVYTTEVGCGLCGYKSKVRTNIIRHLKLHIDGLAPTDLPTTACVNPVPCLERDELMFDKMTNLAYNSHQVEVMKTSSLPSTTTLTSAGRMGGSSSMKLEPKTEQQQHKDKSGVGSKTKWTYEEGEGPLYVPCNKRYVCGALDCNYLCHDEIVFRRHIQALHSHSEVSYRCRHCPPEKTSSAPAMMNVELVLRHLRLHAATLYKCAHCPFLHNMRSIIDRHITERHLEKNVPNWRAIITVRDIAEVAEEDKPDVHSNSPNNSGVTVGGGGGLNSNSEANKSSVMSSGKDAKQWRCAMCKARCVTVEDIVAHTKSKHKIGSRYKCGYCDYSNDERDSYIPHFAEHHPDSPTPDIITIYFHHSPSIQSQTTTATMTTTQSTAYSKDLDISSITNDSSDIDQSLSFDTTPLWRKPSTGDVRHIRGILLETRGQHKKDGIEKGAKGGSGVKRDHKWTIGGGEGVVEVEDGGVATLMSPPKKQPKTTLSVVRASKRVKTLSSSLPSSSVTAAQQLKQTTITEEAKQKVQEVFSAHSLVISMPVDQEVRYHSDVRCNLRLVDVNNLSIRVLLIRGNLMGKFGEYGRPTARGYLCPRCNIFETNGERPFLAHLYKEIGYMRYRCERCGTRSSLTENVYLRCPNAPAFAQPPDSDCIIKSHSDVSKEQWAFMVLAVQTRIAAHLSANDLWANLRDGQGVDLGAGALMKGLKLAYSLKGTFRPADIFPESPPTRFVVLNNGGSTAKEVANTINLCHQNDQRSPPNNRYPLRNTASTSSIEDNLPVNVIERSKKPPLANNMASKLNNIFAQMKSNKPPTLVQMAQQQQRGRRKCKRQPKGGIQMFPEVVTIDADAEVMDTDEGVMVDNDEDDDVEIIDPLVDVVNLVEAEIPGKGKHKPSILQSRDSPVPAESVTVSSFLPSLGDNDPLMDDAGLSDNDSVALEIAEDDEEDIDEELEPLQLEVNPTTWSNTSKNLEQHSPSKKPLPSDVNKEKDQTTIKQNTLTIKPLEQLQSVKPKDRNQEEEAQDEVVSSTTSDNQQSGRGGIIATLTPIIDSSSLVGRLRVIGDASMVGCFGLSSRMKVQLTTQTPQTIQTDETGQTRATAQSPALVVQQRNNSKVLQKCQHCDFCSMNPQSLRKHEIRHWVEKPYRCGYVATSGAKCDFQHHFRPNVARHIVDSHPAIPGHQVIPVIRVNITNPTIVGLRGKRMAVTTDDQGGPNLGSIHDGNSTPTAKRLRIAAGTDTASSCGVDGSNVVEEEGYMERFTCPSCTFTSHRHHYVQQHLRLHVKCIKCIICNEKDVQKKRLLEEKCVVHHESIHSRLIIEYDSYEMDRLKRLIQRILVPISSPLLPAPLSVDQPPFQALTDLPDLGEEVVEVEEAEEENEFLEVYKTIRNYPRQPRAKKQKANKRNVSAQRMTTFDVATSTYVPLPIQQQQQQQEGADDIAVNSVYNVDDLADGGGVVKEQVTTVVSHPAPIVLNSLLAPPRSPSTSITAELTPTARKSTGGSLLSSTPLYAAANFYNPAVPDDGDLTSSRITLLCSDTLD